eukprot:GHVU01215752.1.p2 GENE.GHVU01215752.1~~GHVU01215752.1.p2  ORF type:complete len:161 (+),score=8.97 GHVU01215752.1:1582-2064(+)
MTRRCHTMASRKLTANIIFSYVTIVQATSLAICQSVSHQSPIDESTVDIKSGHVVDSHHQCDGSITDSWRSSAFPTVPPISEAPPNMGAAEGKDAHTYANRTKTHTYTHTDAHGRTHDHTSTRTTTPSLAQARPHVQRKGERDRKTLRMNNPPAPTGPPK